MRKTWVSVLGTLFMSWGLATAQAQQLPTPPGPVPPVPPPVADTTPTPAPTPTPATRSDITITTPPTQAPPPTLSVTAQPGPGAAPAQPGSTTAAQPGFLASLGIGLGLGGGGCGTTNGCCGIFSNLGNVGNLFGGCGCDTGPLNITVGGGVYWVQPFFGSNPAFFTRTGTHTTQNDYVQHMTVAPTGFIAWQFAPDWAVKFRWWQIDTNGSQSAGGGTTVSDAGGTTTGIPTSARSTIGANSELYMSVYNLEIAKKWIVNPSTWFELSGGVAYVHMSQSGQVNIYDPVLGNSFSDSNHNFNGFGPTMAFEGHYKLGCSDFGLYGSARGSLLFGSSVQNYNTNIGGVNSGSATNSSIILPVGEMELGAEWSHVWGRFRLSAQVGVVGQIWFNGGAATEGANLNGLNLGGQQTSASNFGFIGGVARAGISF